jgi:SAM-dependent methyltransferase
MPINNIKKYVQDILPLILGDTLFSYELSICNCNKEPIPYSEIIGNLNHEYLVLIIFENNVSTISAIAKKLSKFINKNVFYVESENKTILYWFEGEEINPETSTSSKKIDTSEHLSSAIARIKSETRLPVWLDKFLFDTLLAEYAPDFDKYDFNLNHSEIEILTYLGTYFPRSYSESYCIFNDLFNNVHFKKEYQTKEIVNVLDIGSGTGGNLIGLLTALEKNLNQKFKVNIWAIDGNQDSLKFLTKITEKFKQYSQNKFEIKTINATVENINHLSSTFQSLDCQSFDFITSFKAVGEIISYAKSKNGQEYFDLALLCCPLLSDLGLLLILDVTTKAKNSTFLPILLNEQIRRFIKANNSFRILSPLSCNFFSQQCNTDCFYYHEFTISHKKKTKDVSRVVFKIVGRKKLVDDLSKDFKIGRFVIDWKHFDQENESKCCCPISLNEVVLSDSYKLS